MEKGAFLSDSNMPKEKALFLLSLFNYKIKEGES